MDPASSTSVAPLSLDQNGLPNRPEPLSPAIRGGLLGLVIFFHVGCGWALTLIDPPAIVAGDAPPMEVRMVSAEAPPQPQPRIDIPLPEDTPPPELEPELESTIQPPPPDLPPPAFPIHKPPPPPKPKPHVAEPHPPKPHPPRKALPESSPQQAAPGPAQPAAPKTVAASQVSFLVRPNPIYPARSRRNNEQGVATIRVLIDVTGRPSRVSLESSSGHPALDQSALSAVRAAQFRPYSEAGVAQPVWVLVPIKFVLQ
jgi:protein TonB